MQEKIENITKIIHRLQEYVKCKGITLNQIAVAIGASNSYFSKMANNEGSLGEEVIRKILLYYDDLDPDWLVTGRGKMTKSEALSQNSDTASVDAKLVQALADANRALSIANKTILNQQEMIAYLSKSAECSPPLNFTTNPTLNPVDNK